MVWWIDGGRKDRYMAQWVERGRKKKGVRTEKEREGDFQAMTWSS